MKLKFVTGLNKLIPFALCLLGFPSCAHRVTSGGDSVDSPKGKRPQPVYREREIMALYGVPTVEYRISGKVVDEDDKPVEGVKVYPHEKNLGDKEESKYKDMAVITDENGVFSIEKRVTSFSDDELNLIYDASDIVTEQYQNDTVSLKLKQVAKGANAFDRGTFKSNMKKHLLRKK